MLLKAIEPEQVCDVVGACKEDPPLLHAAPLQPEAVDALRGAFLHAAATAKLAAAKNAAPNGLCEYCKVRPPDVQQSSVLLRAFLMQVTSPFP